LQYLENESIETTGQTCDIYRLIHELDKYEIKHNQRPKVAMKPTFHTAHTGLYEPNPALRRHKSASTATIADSESSIVFSTNATETDKSTDNKPSRNKSRNRQNKDESSKSTHKSDNKDRRDQSHKSSRSKSTQTDRDHDHKKSSKQRYDRDDSPKRQPYRSRNDNKSKKPQYTDEERKAYNKKKQGQQKSDHKQRRKPNSGTQKTEEKTAITGPLRNPTPEQEEKKSFYANIGKKPCICTPMPYRPRRSKN